jgi:hypothetical protein
MDDNFNNLNNDKLEMYVTSVTTGSSLTPASINTQYNVTALAEAVLFNAPSGTPRAGWKMIIRIRDNGNARALSWNAIYRNMGATLPTTTVANKTMYLGFIYNGTDAYWDLMSSVTEA